MRTIKPLNFPPGEIINGRYEILHLLGKGWEGEVYLVKELSTGIERAAKFFYPERNKGNKTSKHYARKLHKLRNCGIVIQYYTQDSYFHEQPITFLISEFIEGELLSEFVNRHPGKRLLPFAAVHLLHSLATGLECVHRMKEYHGDLHTDNVMVQRVGLRFELKILDLYKRTSSKAENVHDDVIDLIQIFYDVLGGKKHYSKQPQPVKDIICGLKRSLILKKFKTAGQLKSYLENMDWE